MISFKDIELKIKSSLHLIHSIVLDATVTFHSPISVVGVSFTTPSLQYRTVS